LRYWDRRSSADDIILNTNAVIRDKSSWYHILLSVNYAASTSTDRAKIYINGVEQTYSATSYPSTSEDSYTNANTTHYIASPGVYYDGSITQFYFIDGQALDPSYFGYTDALTNTWRPKKFKPQATPNDGTVWSSGTVTNTGSGIYSGSWANVFDGDFSITNNNWVYVYSNSTTRLTFPKALSGLIEVYGTNGATSSTDSAGTDTIVLSDGSTYDVSAIPVSNGVWYSFGQKTGITYIEIRHNSGSGQGTVLRSIKVNGVPLLDSDTTNIGANGFYLPFDGSAPIGQDQSGRGNNWTPVNFGGSNTLEKATGALPILNTDGGGKVARVGVRTDSSASSLVLALPLVGIKSDFSNAVNSGTSNKAITANGNATASSAQSNFYGGSFAFDGTGDYLTVTNNSDFDFGSGNYTLEVWVYPTDVSTTRNILSRSYDGGTGNYSGFILSTANFLETTSQSSWDITISKTLIANTWQHLAVVRSGNTWTYYVNGVSSGTATVSGSVPTGPGDVQIGRRSGQGEFQGYMGDVRFYKGLAKYTSNFIPASTDPDILPDTPSGVSYSSNVALVPSTDGAVAFDGSGDYLSISSPPTDIRDWFTNTNFTLEYFVYANAFGSNSNGGSNVIGNASAATTDEYWSFGPKSDGAVRFYYWSGSGNSFTTTQTLATRKWYHLAFVKSSSSLKIYIDGIESASSTLSVSPQSGAEIPFLIGKVTSGGDFNGFISNINLVNGTALYTSNFTPPSAPISSVANTKLLCCKSNSSATAFDVSPGTITANGNAAATNFNPFTVNINTQRGKQSGYCTLNPLKKGAHITSVTNGNLQFESTGSSQYGQIWGTVAVNSGKWYWEGTEISGGGIAYGWGLESANSLTSEPGGDANTWVYLSSGYKYNNGSIVSYGFSSDDGDTIGVAFNADNGELSFYKNGIYMGVAYTLTTGRYYAPVTGDPNSSTNCSGVVNFGQKPFKFPPPAGFQPLALANTPRPTIVRPDQFVGVTTYTGTGAASRPVTNLGFKPDFVWIKNRSSGSYSHQLFDSVRGASAGCLYSDLTNAQDSNFPITSFDTSGFTLGSSASLASQSYASQNGSGSNYVAWAWKAGGNSNTYNINDVGYATASDAGLTAGTITPTGASVNTKSGFSIITWTRASTADSISHGLGVAPKFIICKSRSNDIGWMIGHAGLDSTSPWNYRIFFDTGARNSDGNTSWNGVPTSSVFYTGNTGYITGNMVAYCWAEVPGFSKFGSYTGNGSTDGSMVITGFRPKFLLVKNTTSAYDWRIHDTSRDPYNVAQTELFPNGSYAEAQNSAYYYDILSNGFKLRTSDIRNNGSGDTYIYAAFAETPTQNLYGAQSNAR